MGLQQLHGNLEKKWELNFLWVFLSSCTSFGEQIPVQELTCECLVHRHTNIRCERHQMRLCDQSSLLLRKKCKGHKLQLFPQTIPLVFWGFFWGLCFFPIAIHYNIQTKHLQRKDSSLANKTWLFLQYGYMACGVQNFLLFLLHSTALGSSHGLDTVLIRNSVLELQTLSNKYRSSFAWLSKTFLA